jgi:acetaldehyde dehydrogenase (acetylating)
MKKAKINAAIIGPGNIGTDLMYKIVRKSKFMDLKLVTGIYPESEGLALARKEGIETSASGIQAIIERDDIQIVFDATGAKPHSRHAPILLDAGITAVDLTPAAVGPHVIPVINLEEHLDKPNLNLITCGGQATIPIVKAITRASEVSYSEIVSIIASKSAGPGTRQNIDEFTITTAEGIVTLGGAPKGKAIILLNPAKPPITNNDTIYAILDNFDEKAIIESVEKMVCDVQRYVPGYRLRLPPTFDGNRVVTMVEVEGSGDYLPVYSGNLDIMTCAALAVGERIAENKVDNI